MSLPHQLSYKISIEPLVWEKTENNKTMSSLFSLKKSDEEIMEELTQINTLKRELSAALASESYSSDEDINDP